MIISGLQKLTLLDFPGHVGAILFLGGCNFRCPFCQNSSLVLPGNYPQLSMDEVTCFLKKRMGILEGICVTGGEPTLNQDLPQLLKFIKSLGYLVKLDTNGTNPAMVESLLSQGLLDYVAMDIKAGKTNYHKAAGLAENQADHALAAIDTSIQLLRNNSIEHEFRTTVVKGIHTEQDFQEIASWIPGCSHYYLQSFRDCPEVLMRNHSFEAFSEAELNRFLAIIQKEIPQASLRG